MADDSGISAARGATSGTTDPSFGDLLRSQRRAAGLTQEELAERAGLSVRGIADLERGARLTPRRDTIALLLRALGSSAGDAAALAAAARRPRFTPPPGANSHGLRPTAPQPASADHRVVRP